jgi:regulator of protease activity HflC (stomatin/prohibitin superfamily)
MKNTLLYLTSVLLLSSCTVIRPGEIGIKQRLGKLNNEVVTQGSIVYNPLISKVVKASSQTKNIELSLSLPSKEGLSITSQISILYRINPEKLPMLIRNIGLEYEGIITNVFRSASADVCAQYFAKDMHSGMRSSIENAIKNKMVIVLEPQGIIIEAVLMKSIQLPGGLASSIEQKLQAEQNAMRMEFLLQQEKLEAERVIIEAKGRRDSQKILSEGLTDEIIKIRTIEAFLELAKSPNAKVIVTDGKTPMLIDNNK